jgi:hypothetical protein
MCDSTLLEGEEDVPAEERVVRSGDLLPVWSGEAVVGRLLDAPALSVLVSGVPLDAFFATGTAPAAAALLVELPG